MDGGQRKNSGLMKAQPELGDRYAEAADTSTLTYYANRAKRVGLYEIHPEGGDEPFIVKAKGRDAWALDRLIEAGSLGCTSIEQPAPRWSSYVHKLRSLGVPIATRHEHHGGVFAGTHGRYILLARVVKVRA